MPWIRLLVLVVETRLTGAGIFFQGVTRSWDFLVRLGSVDFEALGDLGDQRAYGGSGSFSMLPDSPWAGEGLSRAERGRAAG